MYVPLAACLRLACLICSLLFLHHNPAQAQTGPAAPLGEGRLVVSGDSTKPRDPIATVAHGALFDQDMKPIKLTPEFVRLALDIYIGRLEGEASAETRELLAKHRSALEAEKLDAMSQRFLELDFLINAVAPVDQPYLDVRSKQLRRNWYRELFGTERSRVLLDQRTGLPNEIRDLGEKLQLMNKATDAEGAEYRDECRKAQVPIPPDWGDKAWDYKGVLTTNFLNFGSPTEVWVALSGSPRGICVALPRIAGTTIRALGIICLGTESNNACFYDAADVPVGADVPIEDFLAGGNLTNGVCTDCHAGENPYVVHPSGPLNLAPDNMGSAWYSPLIKPSWPQNPGPFALLGMVPINELPPDNDASCQSCHRQGQAGRFPDILALNTIAGGESEYCRAILKQAIGNTMPGSGSAYDKHINAMYAFCGQVPLPSGDVPIPDTKDDPGIVSPPIVLGPLYACVSALEVSGGIYGAKITVRVNGSEAGSERVTRPSQTIIAVPPLIAGDVVTAIQESDGAISATSQPVVVINHKDAYPSGLPRPTIDPTVIHQCGATIAVRHVRGATVSVLTNGGSPATYTPGSDWTNLPPAISPFNLGDVYTAEQSLCTEVSALSMPEDAGPPPSPMPVPAFDPAPPVAGQPVVNITNLAEGARTTVAEASAGDLNSFSTAVTWAPEIDVATNLGRPIAAGDRFIILSSLCEETKVEILRAEPCKQLAPPRIVTPLVGQTFVTLTDAAPGARILIYDAALAEIGDGSGTTVGLTRAIVAGDVLTVIQRLGECRSSAAYRTGVVCASGEKCG